MAKRSKLNKEHQVWECSCGFYFEFETTDPEMPTEQLKKILLKPHTDKEGHKLTGKVVEE